MSKLHPIAATRSILAFVLPALLANLALLSIPLLGRRRARNASARLIGWLGPRLAGFRIRIEGETQGLLIRPAVLIFNHQSGIDPVVLAAIAGRDCVGVAKHSLRRHPLLGPLLWLSGTLFLHAGDRRQDIVEQAAARLQQNTLAVAIAPEGRRARRLQPFRPGALRLARTARVPLVPIVIHNSHEILGPHGLVMRPGTVRVSVLAPQEPNDTTNAELEQLFRHALADDSAA